MRRWCWRPSGPDPQCRHRHNDRVTTTPCTIRAALPSDEAAWRLLWQRLLRFLPGAAVRRGHRRTWKRILDPDSQVMCIVAEVDGQVYGFANCVVHENTWETQAVCYLEDLFTPAAGGRGLASALIEWLRNAMRAEGWARLYWMTREDNVRPGACTTASPRPTASCAT